LRILGRVALIVILATGASFSISHEHRIVMAQVITPSTANVVSVQGSSKELVQGYLAWLHRHPKMMLGSGDRAAQPGSEGTSYKIVWPYLDIYSSDGVPVYHGDESSRNVQAIQGLPMHIPVSNVSPNGPLHPTFSEAVGMFHELSPTVMAASKSTTNYTVYVISHGDRSACKQQDEAIAALEKRIGGSDVRLVEVHIKAGN